MVMSSPYINYKSMIKVIFVSFGLFLMLLSITAFAASSIKVTVDRNPVSLSDSFQLTFTANQSPDDDPDFSPLKQNFDILNQQKSSQSSWINGKSSKTITWTLTVMAKKVGTVTIPQIHFGNDVTDAATITIKNTNDDQIDQNAPLFLDISVSTKQAYVQSQIIYTVKLYQRVNITQASLSEPEANNVIVEKLGDDVSYNTQLNNINYYVTERNYALFPQKSGALTIAPLVLTAEIVTDTQNNRFNRLFSMQNTQTKRISSKAMTFDILPAPAEFTGKHWLPAKNITLAQAWTNETLTVNAGEPITRTLQIQAKGITSSQLPDLVTDYQIDNLKTYPDKIESQQEGSSEGIATIRQQKVAIIASQPGTYTLPAIDIPWFNTTTKTIEHAILPAATITVIGTTQQASKNTISKNPAVVNTQATTLQKTTSLAQPNPTTSSTHSLWKWLAISFGVLWLITIVILLKISNIKTTQAKPNKIPQIATSNVSKKLKQACEKNDAKMALDLLNTWGKQHYQRDDWQIMLDKNTDEKLHVVLNQLNRALYAATSQPWQVDTLLQLINDNYFAQTKSKSKTSQLEPLNRI